MEFTYTPGKGKGKTFDDAVEETKEDDKSTVVVDRRLPIADYMETVQTCIDPVARAHSVDLVMEAAVLLKRRPNIVHVAVHILDCYLSGNNVDVRTLLVAAVTCLKMADRAGDVGPYTHLCCGSISGYEFLMMELHIQDYFNHKVNFASVLTAYSFLTGYVRIAQHGRHARLQGLDRVAAYLVDVSVLWTDMLRFRPEMIAASSVFLAQYIMDPYSERPWSVGLRNCSKFKASDLQGCVLALHGLLDREESSMRGITLTNCRREENVFETTKVIPPAIPLHIFEEVYY